MASGSSPPLPCLPTARRSRCKGAQRAGAGDEPLSARPALAVAIPRSFASLAKVQRRRREREIAMSEATIVEPLRAETATAALAERFYAFMV